MSDRLDTDKNLLVLGQIGKVHGIQGWLKLKSFTTPPENILDYTSLLAEFKGSWQLVEIDQHRRQANGLVVHFKGVDDPETARGLTGLELSVERAALPALQPDDYYWHQLEGLDVVNQHGELFGQVATMLETGANDVLVVAPSENSIDDRERLIPYLVGTVVVKIDLDKGLVAVNWEADYLA
ncbi:MAG: ribosome maturation factor RimM [Proteobacteria bacterium]|nr:ribosome maturation factor RimM [Pseudomonadota bacterium]